MPLVPNMHRIATEQVQQVGKDICGTVGYRRWHDGRRPDQSLSRETGEYLVRGCEKYGKAQGEEVGTVARCIEDVSRDLKLAVADGHENGLLVELRHQLRQRVELCIGKEPHKVPSIAGLDMIALQM